MTRSYFMEPEIRYGELYFSYATSFRKIALEIEEDPLLIKNHLSLPAIDFLLSDRTSTTLERTEYLEALAYGDPGVLLASPGPSLSGLMMRELGVASQIDDFYELIQSNKLRTFFALTEPNTGSNANEIITSLKKSDVSGKQYILDGQKCFFGNGAVAETGIVLAKIGATPVGIRAVWLTPELLKTSGITRYTLPMFSLKGAQIAYMNFEHVHIPKENILGLHRSACENGLLSIIKVFNQLRTGVGALAIGQAQAVYDTTYLIYQDKLSVQPSYFYELNYALAAARLLLKNAARKVDQDSLDSAMVSLAKANATKTAERVINACIDICALEDLMQHPWMLKAYRDVFCWEYMEGTTEIQKKHIAKNINHFLIKMEESIT